MYDFKQWCERENLTEVVYGKKAPMESGKKVAHKCVDGGRDGTEDLDDYKGHMGRNGTVEPFELAKKKGKKK